MCTPMQEEPSRWNLKRSRSRASAAVVQADAAGINGSTDAGLTPFPPATMADAISDDRLFMVAEISSLLKIRRSDVYSACDHGHLLRYLKFEGIVQVEAATSRPG
jgi:hypothetical protein